MITFVAANPSLDKSFEVERIVPGAIHRPLAFTQVAGGKAVNAARAAAALGARVQVVVLAGGHAGRWLVERLEGLGVDVLVVESAAETRSSLSVFDRDSGALTEFYEAGARIAEDEWGRLERGVTERLPTAGWLSISGSLPPGAPADGYARLLRAGRAVGLATALDASGEALRHGVEACPALLKVNAEEAGELLATTIASAPSARAAAERLAGASGAAAITRGVDGATLCVRGEEIWEGRHPGRGSYPVGSGDSFLGGLLVARDRGEDWPAALALGLGAAAASAEVPSPAGFDRARAEELATGSEIAAIER